MRVQFVEREDAPERLLAEAEIIFEDGPLAGLKLVGISVWKSAEGDPNVTFPARSFGSGGQRRFWDLLRVQEAGSTAARRVKDWIVAEFKAARVPA